MILALLLAGACAVTDTTEPKDAACPIEWTVTDPLRAIERFEVWADGELCGVVLERRWVDRQGRPRRQNPPTLWNPYRAAATSPRCSLAPGKSIDFRIYTRYLDGPPDPTLSQPYRVVGVGDLLCCTIRCAPCRAN